MFNNQLVSEMINKFGKEATTQWCRMEAHKYDLLSAVDVYSKEVRCEMEYEHKWWNQKYEELLKTLSHE